MTLFHGCRPGFFAARLRLWGRLTALLMLILAVMTVRSDGAVPTAVVARPENDMLTVLRENGVPFRRYDTLREALAAAEEGSGMMVLADDYPQVRNEYDAKLDAAVQAKKIRLYLEFPCWLPDAKVTMNPSMRFTPHDNYIFTYGNGYLECGPYGSCKERTVTTSDFFAWGLPNLAIMEMKDCYFVPFAEEDKLEDWTTHMVLSRVEGYDTAVCGLTEAAHPILLSKNGRPLLVATTKLSHFITGRYLPYATWRPVITQIVRWVSGDEKIPLLAWTPSVRPMYGEKETLPADADRTALRRAVDYYGKSNLYIHPGWPYERGVDPISPDWPKGDGTCGIGECYISKRVFQDGSQAVSRNRRTDCNLEAAMGLAAGIRIFDDPEAKDKMPKLIDCVFDAHKTAAAGNPEHPAYGLLGWSLGWQIDNFWCDDNARALLSLIAAAAFSGRTDWNDDLVRSVLGNARNMGTNGYRPHTFTAQNLAENGWEHYYNSDFTFCCPHHECFIWAVYLWLYEQTKFEPLLERSRRGIQLMMEAYPDKWLREANRQETERSRMLLPLAWLVRADDTPEHRQWLDTLAQDIIRRQDESGAIPQVPGSVAGWNRSYGEVECALVHEEGDPCTDALYAINFAFVGMEEAARATGNPAYRASADKMADFFIRSQTQSQTHPELDGTWYRGFDFDKWDYWGSDGDAGWGVLTNEIGWTHSWITLGLALREMDISLWELASQVDAKPGYAKYKEIMLPGK